jgi:hypothetical protein
MKYLRKTIHKIIIILGIFLIPAASYSSEADEAEEKLKTAFIFRFTEFVDSGWGHKKGQVVNFCILTKLNQENKTFYGKFSNRNMAGDKLNIIYNPTIKATKKCEVIYFTKSYEKKIDSHLANIKNGAITVSDKKYFIEKGGLIEFYKFRGKVGFRINNDKAVKSGLLFNAKLLELADIR